MTDHPLPQAAPSRAAAPVAAPVAAPSRVDGQQGGWPGETPGRSLPARGGRALLLGGALALGGFAAFFVAGAAEPGDRVSPDEAARRASGFAAAGSVRVPHVHPRDAATALVALNLPAPDRARLAADVEAGRLRLVWLSLFDSDAEDGDVVTLSSGGFTYPVALSKAPATLAVPVLIGGTIALTGTRDGGGGVTVGVVGSGGPLPLPPLSVGQTVPLPLAAR